MTPIIAMPTIQHFHPITTNNYDDDDNGDDDDNNDDDDHNDEQLWMITMMFKTNH